MSKQHNERRFENRLNGSVFLFAVSFKCAFPPTLIIVMSLARPPTSVEVKLISGRRARDCVNRAFQVSGPRREAGNVLETINA